MEMELLGLRVLQQWKWSRLENYENYIIYRIGRKPVKLFQI